MTSLKLSLHLLFSKERHGVSAIVFILLFSILLGAYFLLLDYPIKKAKDTYSLMDDNNFIITTEYESQTEDPSTNLDFYLSEAEENYDSLIESIHYQDRVLTHYTGIIFRSRYKMNINFVYLPLEMNINNFGNIYEKARYEDEVFNVYDETYGGISNEIFNKKRYANHSLALDDLSLMFYSSTFFFSDTTLFELFTSDYVWSVDAIFYSIQLNDTLTYADSAYLIYSSYDNNNIGVSVKYEKAFSYHYDIVQSFAPYELNLLLANSLCYMIILFTTVFLISLSFSNYLALMKKKEELRMMKAFGLKDHEFVLFTGLSSFLFGLIGYLIFLIFYAIGNAIFTNIAGFSLFNGFVILFAFLVLLLLSFSNALTTVFYNLSSKKKEGIDQHLKKSKA